MNEVQLLGKGVVFVVQDFKVQTMFFNGGSTMFGQLRRNGIQARVCGSVFLDVFVKS